ncbi:MAG: sarcosine oxidase subunit gamma [Rhodobacteraceae bacterium]|nr:sarcosine oxidase subunit gamma [Paracoccaceae bacterium]
MPEIENSNCGGGFHQPPIRAMAMFRGSLSDTELTTRLAAALDVNLPKKLRISAGNGVDVAWMSPDELLLMMDGDGERTLNAVGDALRGMHHLIADVSAMRVEFELTGPVRDILAKGTPADVSPNSFKIGDFRRSRIGQIQAAYWLTDDTTARIICRRSEAEYLSGWLEVAVAKGGELGFYHR